MHLGIINITYHEYRKKTIINKKAQNWNHIFFANWAANNFYIQIVSFLFLSLLYSAPDIKISCLKAKQKTWIKNLLSWRLDSEGLCIIFNRIKNNTLYLLGIQKKASIFHFLSKHQHTLLSNALFWNTYYKFALVH